MKIIRGYFHQKIKTLCYLKVAYLFFDKTNMLFYYLAFKICFLAAPCIKLNAFKARKYFIIMLPRGIILKVNTTN